MKQLFTCSTLLFLAACFSGCENESKPVSKSDTLPATESAADSVVTENYVRSEEEDTIYPMEIHGKSYQLMLTLGEYPSREDERFVTTTVRIIENETSDTLFKETFEYNSIGRFFHPAPDHYWINLTNESGGSGYSGTLFNIRLEPEIRLQPVTNISELSFWESNKTATEILFFQAYWYTTAGLSDMESHFSTHRQSMGIYKIMEDTIIYKDLGMTKYRYDLHAHKFEENGNDNIILRLKKQETALTGMINWDEYDLGE
jgi:hypothetical protein